MTDKSSDTAAEAQPPKKAGKRLGALLRDAREDAGVTLAQCEEKLRIKAEYLLALENGHYHLLPTATHAKGFLRTYVAHLGLDKQLAALQEKFLEETTAMQQSPQLAMPAPVMETRAPTRAMMTGGVIAAVVIYIIYLWLAAPIENREANAPVAVPIAPMIESAAEETLAPAPAETTETPATALVEGAPASEEPAETAAAAAGVAEEQPVIEEKPVEKKTEQRPAELSTAVMDAPVAIQVLKDSWIQVQDDMGATIYSRLHAAGTTYIPPRESGLTLTVGNAGGVRIIRDGEIGAPLGAVAEVKRDIPLTPREPNKKGRH